MCPNSPPGFASVLAYRHLLRVGACAPAAAGNFGANEARDDRGAVGLRDHARGHQGAPARAAAAAFFWPHDRAKPLRPLTLCVLLVSLSQAAAARRRRREATDAVEAAVAAAALGRQAGAAKTFARRRRADFLRACGARGRRVRPPTVAVCVSVSGVRGAQKCAFAFGRDGVRGVAGGQIFYCRNG